MTTYKIAGYSYEKGYFVDLGTIEAKSNRSALIKARKQFDSQGLGYAEFVASEVK